MFQISTHNFFQNYCVLRSNHLPIVCFYFTVHSNLSGDKIPNNSDTLLLDTGASRSLCSSNFIEKHRIQPEKRSPVTLTGFNKKQSFSDKQISLSIFDNNLNLFKEIECIVVQNMPQNVILGFNDMLQSHPNLSVNSDEITISNNFQRLTFKRALPLLINIQPRYGLPYLVPGKNVIKFSKRDYNQNIFNITCSNNKIENINIVLERFDKSNEIMVKNTSCEFVNINELDFKVNQKIDQFKPPVTIRPPHYRKTLSLPPLDLSQIKIGPINEQYKMKLIKLVEKYHYIFSRDDSDIGTYNGPFRYEIKLANPIVDCYKERTFTTTESTFIRAEISKMLKNEIIIEYKTARIFCGIVLARKKTPTGPKLRFCLNSTLVNKESRVNHNFPLPNLENCIRNLANWEYYSRFDLAQAFWQVSLPTDQLKYYTFSFEGKSYAFVRSSYGTRGMPSYFSALMEDVYKDIDQISIYMDDVSTFGPDIDSQLKIIEKIFHRTSEYNLTMGLPKCQFLFKKINAFGYSIDATGYIPSPDRYEKILRLPCPNTLTRLQSAIGSLTYYHKSIKNFKTTISRFYDLLSNFKYDSSLESHWKALMKEIAKCVKRNRPDYDRELIIATDASDLGGGCTFSQKIDGNDRIILLDSFRHVGRMLLCKASFQEFSCIHSCFKKHRKFIQLFPRVKILTDNKVCVALLANIHSVKILKKSIPARWLSFLSLFNFSVEHRSGKSHEIILSDILSREGQQQEKNLLCLGELMSEEAVEWKNVENPSETISEINSVKNDLINEDIENNLLMNERQWIMDESIVNKFENDINCKSYFIFPFEESSIQQVTNCDNDEIILSENEDNEIFSFNKESNVKTHEILRNFDVEKIRDKVKLAQYLNNYSNTKKSVETRLEKIIHGKKIVEYPISYDRGKLIIPNEMIQDLLMLTHRHTQPYLWYKNILKFGLTCPNLHKNVYHYWKSCTTCQSLVKPREKFIKSSVSAPDDIGDLCSTDVLHLNQEKYLFLKDQFSGYMLVEKIANETEKEILEKLMKMILTAPFYLKSLNTDNHASFKSRSIKEFCEAMNIYLTSSSSRNSRGNSDQERSFVEINRQVRLLQKTSAPLWLQVQIATFLYNNKKVKSKNMHSPLEIINFRESSFPVNLPSLSLNKLRTLSKGTKLFYDAALDILQNIKEQKLKQLDTIPDHQIKLYNVGDWVLIKSYPNQNQSKKLLPTYSEQPYEIIEKFIHTKTYTVQRIDPDTRINRVRFRVHHRITRRINKKKKETSTSNNNQSGNTDLSVDIDSNKNKAKIITPPISNETKSIVTDLTKNDNDRLDRSRKNVQKMSRENRYNLRQRK